MTVPPTHSFAAPAPSTACTAVLSALSGLQLVNGGAGRGGSGCVRTIKRYAQDRYLVEEIDRVLAAGLPAMLVAYLGGSWEPCATHGQLFQQRCRFTIICAAGRYSAAEDRLAGTTPAVDPGVEDLLDWATFYGLRALHGAGLRRIRPLEHRWLRIEADKYLAAAELEGTRQLDIYDDAVAGTLETLGIVHDPLDLDELFLADNETPNTPDPATVRGGVTDL